MITALIIGWEDGTDETATGWWYYLDGVPDILVGPLGPPVEGEENVFDAVEAAVALQVARKCNVDVSDVRVMHYFPPDLF